jgi:hypothetical protein
MAYNEEGQLDEKVLSDIVHVTGYTPFAHLKELKDDIDFDDFAFFHSNEEDNGYRRNIKLGDLVPMSRQRKHMAKYRILITIVPNKFQQIYYFHLHLSHVLCSNVHGIIFILKEDVKMADFISLIAYQFYEVNLPFHIKRQFSPDYCEMRSFLTMIKTKEESQVESV